MTTGPVFPTETYLPALMFNSSFLNASCIGNFCLGYWLFRALFRYRLHLFHKIGPLITPVSNILFLFLPPPSHRNPEQIKTFSPFILIFNWKLLERWYIHEDWNSESVKEYTVKKSHSHIYSPILFPGDYQC